MVRAYHVLLHVFHHLVCMHGALHDSLRVLTDIEHLVGLGHSPAGFSHHHHLVVVFLILVPDCPGNARTQGFFEASHSWPILRIILSFPSCVCVGGLVFEFRLFVAGWRHAIRSEWPLISPVPKERGLPLALHFACRQGPLPTGHLGGDAAGRPS